MISLVFALACAADDSVATGGSGSDDSDTGAPATEVTDTEGFNGTSPREPVPVPLPTFAALNQYGDPRGPEDLLGHATVIWFYPLADTPGWTEEGCGYRDLYEQFQALDVEIVGASYGSPEAHLEWATEENFQYELWTDEDRQLSIAYGTGSTTAWFPDRETFLINREGDLILEYVDDVDTAANPYQVLADCTILFGEE